jgi:hypothetical protein
MRDRGVPLHLDPALRLVFERHFGFCEFIGHCRASGRTFARQRLSGTSVWRRTLYAVTAATVLPVILVGRLGARAFSRKSARTAFLVALPWIVAYEVAWSFGEAQGAIEATPRHLLTSLTSPMSGGDAR